MLFCTCLCCTPVTLSFTLGVPGEQYNLHCSEDTWCDRLGWQELGERSRKGKPARAEEGQPSLTLQPV